VLVNHYFAADRLAVIEAIDKIALEIAGEAR